MRDLITKKFDISNKNFKFVVLLSQKLESKTPEHTPTVMGNSTGLSCNDPDVNIDVQCKVNVDIKTLGCQH